MAARRQLSWWDGSSTNQRPPAQAGQGRYDGRNGSQQWQGEVCSQLCTDRVDVYAVVDSWRANPGVQESNLLVNNSSYYTHQPAVFTPYRAVFHPSSAYDQSSATEQHLKPQSWRSVQRLTRYAKYPVDKKYRAVDQVQLDSHEGDSYQRDNPSNLPSQRNCSLRPKPGPIAKTHEEVSKSMKWPKQSAHIPSIRQSIEKPDLPLPNSAISLFQQRPRNSTPQRTVSPPPAPQATPEYLRQAQVEPVGTVKAQKLLVALDLNGTLVYRPIAPGGSKKSSDIVQRPGMKHLLDYLFANHVVMVYTSARIENAQLMVDQIFTEPQRLMLAAVYARDKLDLNNAQFRGKVQVYKKLDKIWRDKKIQGRCIKTDHWDQRNTILVDDSHLKALAQPHNLLQVPEFKGGVGKKNKAINIKRQEDIMQSLIVKLEFLKWHKDVSSVIRKWQIGKLGIPKVPGSDVVVDEKVDQKEVADAKARAEQAQPHPTSVVLTAKSTVSDESSDDINGVGLNSAEHDSTHGGRASIDNQADRHGPNRHTRFRSESPIPESAWKELLGQNTPED